MGCESALLQPAPESTVRNRSPTRESIPIMARLTQISPEAASGRAGELLDAVEDRLGLVPNMTRAMANSPAALDGYLQLSGALGKGTLPAKVRVQIALAVAQANGCDTAWPPTRPSAGWSG